MVPAKDDNKVTGGLSSSCRPPANHTYLFIGQDLFSIDQYITSLYNVSLHSGSIAPKSSFTPAGAMVYTDIETSRGTKSPADYGSGVEYADGIFDLFPDQSVGLQIGLWLFGAEGCRKIIDGVLDEEIDAFVEYLERCKAKKVFLRIGYEFDNPYFGYSDDPPAYIAAFQIIVDACRGKLSERALGKIEFVWHSWAAELASGLSINAFYPGDDYVDWVGISIFQQLYPWSNTHATMPDGNYASGSKSFVEAVLQYAQKHDKPTMIAESTPFGGIDMNITSTDAALQDPWQRWFEPVLELIDEYDISLWSYINCDWNSQPMWIHSGFGDSRISSDRTVMTKWLNLTTTGKYGNRQFLLANSLESCGFGEPIQPPVVINGLTEDCGFSSTGGVEPMGHLLSRTTCLELSTLAMMMLAFILGGVLVMFRQGIWKNVTGLVCFCKGAFTDCVDTNASTRPRNNETMALTPASQIRAKRVQVA